MSIYRIDSGSLITARSWDHHSYNLPACNTTLSLTTASNCITNSPHSTPSPPSPSLLGNRSSLSVITTLALLAQIVSRVWFSPSSINYTLKPFVLPMSSLSVRTLSSLERFFPPSSRREECRHPSSSRISWISSKPSDKRRCLSKRCFATTMKPFPQTFWMM